MRDVAKIIYGLEQDFIRADFCRDKSRLAGRLSDDFIEYGQSGGKTDKQATIEALSKVTEDRPIRIFDFTVRELSEKSFLAVYRAREQSGRISNHSSVWIHKNGNWKISFHQGTAVPG